MLSIIPKRVLAHLPSIHKLLEIQNNNSVIQEKKTINK
jgi:hypothetical protein